MEDYDVNLHRLYKLNDMKNKLQNINILIKEKENINNKYLKFLQDMMDEAIKRYDIIIQNLQGRLTY